MDKIQEEAAAQFEKIRAAAKGSDPIHDFMNQTRQPEEQPEVSPEAQPEAPEVQPEEDPEEPTEDDVME